MTGANLIVVRNEWDLRQTLIRVEELRSGWLPEVRADEPRPLRRAVEAENVLLVAELMTRAALLRRESRGSHFREDYPRRDDANWGVSILFKLESGEIKHRLARLTPE